MFRVEKLSLDFLVSQVGDRVYITGSVKSKGVPQLVARIIQTETTSAQLFLRYFAPEKTQTELMAYFIRRGWMATNVQSSLVENELGEMSLTYSVPSL